MQPVNQEKVRSAGLGDGGAQSVKKKTAEPSWFSMAQAHADYAARVGFVVSMMFLAATALYALYLSGAAKAAFDEIAGMTDRAAYEAGFRLEDLAVSGAKNTPQTTLWNALGLPYPNSSLFYDTSEAHDRLLKAGWIASAEVRRVLPSRLEVVVTEREPFARWADAENNVQAIDREGHILGPTEGRFENLIFLAGEGAPAEAGEFMDALAGHEIFKRRIEGAELVAERFWQVKLDSGVILKLPRKVNELILGRVESLLASNKIAEMALETIDLRLSNRTILQLREQNLANRDRAIAALNSGPVLPVSPPRRGRAL